MTKRKFAFATQNNLPLIFTSAADGTNVVKVDLFEEIFREALRLGLENKKNPEGNFVSDVLDMLDVLRINSGLRLLQDLKPARSKL